MTDIELVIKIPEEDYYDALQYVKLKVNTEFENLMIRAIKNGTPLPKGHGDLVDISPYKGKVICSRLYSGVKRLIEVNSIEPIVEADKDD